MPKITAYIEIEETLGKALVFGSEPFVANRLDELTEESEIVKEAERQLKDIKKMKQAITINARYYQGKALRSKISKQGSYGMNKHDKSVATHIYDLFHGYEYLMPNYFGSEEAFFRVNNFEITKLRNYLADALREDPINQELDDILTFDCEDTIFPSADRDVVPFLE